MHVAGTTCPEQYLHCLPVDASSVVPLPECHFHILCNTLFDSYYCFLIQTLIELFIYLSIYFYLFFGCCFFFFFFFFSLFLFLFFYFISFFVFVFCQLIYFNFLHEITITTFCLDL